MPKCQIVCLLQFGEGEVSEVTDLRRSGVTEYLEPDVVITDQSDVVKADDQPVVEEADDIAHTPDSKSEHNHLPKSWRLLCKSF